MISFNFSEIGLDGRQYQIQWSNELTSMVDYIRLRGIFSEEACFNFLEQIKQNTGRELAICFGNCQTINIKDFLRNHRIFQKQYFFIELPAVCDYDDETVKLLHEKFWGLCDLFISQRVSRTNDFGPEVSTYQFLNKMPEKSKVIWIPNLYFIGYFPQFIKNYYNVDTHIHSGGRFLNGDKYIDQYLIARNRVRIDELRDYIRNQSFIDAQTVKAHAEHSLKELEQHEWPCDIHMTQYIADRYKKYQMFYASNHPIQPLILELVRRILHFMDIDDVNSFDNMDLLMKNALRAQDIPVYPKVAKILGLQDYLEDFNANICLWPFHGSYLDFLTEYARWCWRDKLVED